MNNKKNHTAKLLSKTAKKASSPQSSRGNKAKSQVGLREQYDIIRNDLLKLREDIRKGYDMARGLVDKNNLKGLLRSK